MAHQLTIPGGRDKGKLPSECDEKSLTYWAESARQDDLKRACSDELARRKGGAIQKPNGNAPRTSIARPVEGSQALELSAGNPAAVTHWFELNKGSFHLITPSTVVQSIPEGCEVAISTIQIDPNPDNGEVYKQKKGKLALTGTSLAKVSAAAGVSWDPRQCRRIDDRSDPRYVEYTAVGGWRLFDGVFIVEQGTRAADLRDGSDEISEMSAEQVAQQRRFILPLAESKAKNRVIRRLGVKSGYTTEELARPFAVARLMWTGRTDDPELRREFARMTAERMNASGAELFGPMHPARIPAQHAHAPAHAPALGPAPHAPHAQLPASYDVSVQSDDGSAAGNATQTDSNDEGDGQY